MCKQFIDLVNDLVQRPSSTAGSARFAWFLSLLWPLFFGGMALVYSLSSEYVVQDDARLHVAWLQQFVDPALFPDDAIAQYYLAIQAIGFQLVYGLAAAVGLSPLLIAKILPLLLALVATVYLHKVALRLLPLPLCGVMVTLVFNQNIWLKDDLASATPRAFIYPLFAAFLYYLLNHQRVAVLLTLGLQGLFYPQMMLVSLGVLTLRLWPVGKLRWRDGATWVVALVMTVGLLLLFSHQTEMAVGSLISLDEMREMPEFYPGGRRAYFGVSPLEFAFAGASGLRLPLFPPIILVGLLLPVLWWRTRRAIGETVVLGQILASAIGLFLLAHLLFPTLYLPSRYTFYSLRFVMAIATGMVLTLALRRAWHWLKSRRSWWRDPQSWIGGALLVAIVVLPAIPAVVLPCQNWVVGTHPKVYRAIAQTPKETLVASLAPAADNIPAFSGRSVLVAREFALPYHREFYDLMQRRMADVVAAQYSPDQNQVAAFIRHYGVDLWLVDQNFAEAGYLTNQDWLINSGIGSLVRRTAAQLHQEQPPVLLQMASKCTITAEDDLILLDAACIAKRIN